MAENAGRAMQTPWVDIRWERTGSESASGQVVPLERVASIMAARVQERCAGGLSPGGTPPRVELAVGPHVAPESYVLADIPRGVRVTGGGARGVLYGAGRLLRESSYECGFTPTSLRLCSAPKCTMRGMYFASHFFNWYHMAPRAELVRYVEDLALWGVNAIAMIFPIIDLTGWDDPRTEAGLEQVRSICAAAHATGLQACLLTCNVGFQDLPDRLRAAPVDDPLHRHGNLGNTMCPSDPEALEHMLAIRRRLFAELANVGIDLLCLWPYDEGGCGCTKCAPWGANGFLRFARAVADLGREQFPDLKVILSTWTFDTPAQGEWEGLSRALSADGDWVDYILAASHDDFPRYPLEHGVPGGKPLLDFPEISMWGLGPWGGLGATPLPQRFQRVWDQAGHSLDGGFPYSEGIYEDINKVIYSQFFWDVDHPAWETVRQYAAYEFSPRVANDVVRMCELIEWNHTEGRLRGRADPGRADEAYELARNADSLLPERARTSWRWRILFIRALLDHERYRIAGPGPWPEAKWNERWRDVLRDSPVAQEALRELMAIYHCPPNPNDADHHHRNFLRPPLAEFP